MDALVSWDPAPEPNVTQHKVFRGLAPDDYILGLTVIVPVPANQYLFTQLDDYKRHYFAVTAVNSVPLESGLSAEVSKRLTHRLTLK